MGIEHIGAARPRRGWSDGTEASHGKAGALGTQCVNAAAVVLWALCTEPFICSNGKGWSLWSGWCLAAVGVRHTLRFIVQSRASHVHFIAEQTEAPGDGMPSSRGPGRPRWQCVIALWATRFSRSAQASQAPCRVHFSPERPPSPSYWQWAQPATSWAWLWSQLSTPSLRGPGGLSPPHLFPSHVPEPMRCPGAHGGSPTSVVGERPRSTLPPLGCRRRSCRPRRP